MCARFLVLVPQCADPKLLQITCLRTAMGRCGRMLQMWRFPRLPFAINALLIQSTAGKEDQVRSPPRRGPHASTWSGVTTIASGWCSHAQTVTMKRLWDQYAFQQRFPAPALLPSDVNALHAIFTNKQHGSISPSQLINVCAHSKRTSVSAPGTSSRLLNCVMLVTAIQPALGSPGHVSLRSGVLDRNSHLPCRCLVARPGPTPSDPVAAGQAPQAG